MFAMGSSDATRLQSVNFIQNADTFPDAFRTSRRGTDDDGDDGDDGDDDAKNDTRRDGGGARREDAWTTKHATDGGSGSHLWIWTWRRA